MPSRRLFALVGTVLTVGVVLIVYENVLLFLEATGSLPPGFVDSPFVLVAIPFALSATLVLLLLGAAVLHAETLR